MSFSKETFLSIVDALQAEGYENEVPDAALKQIIMRETGYMNKSQITQILNSFRMSGMILHTTENIWSIKEETIQIYREDGGD